MTDQDIALKTQHAAKKLIKKNNDTPGSYKKLNAVFLIKLSKKLKDTEADFLHLSPNCIAKIGYNYLHQILPKRMEETAKNCPKKLKEKKEIKSHISSYKNLYIYSLTAAAEQIKSSIKKCCGCNKKQ